MSTWRRSYKPGFGVVGYPTAWLLFILLIAGFWLASLTMPATGAPAATAAAPAAINFVSANLQGTNLAWPTSLQFGPDGRLYVSQQNGIILVYTISRNGPADYSVSHTETIEHVRNLPNHNDDGALNTFQQDRLVTGLLVTGTAANPVLYVSSSDPRVAVGHSSNLDTNSSLISRLTWNGSGWDHLPLVRGLPRSEENHASNGMQLDTSNNILYVAQGGHTNMGAPSHNFANLPEYALSAAILSVDLNAIGNNTYDLPTLGNSGNNPFGGMKGENQAVMLPGGPVQVHSPGYRNVYDLVLTESGRLYTIDNSANAGWGGPPIGGGPEGNCTNESNDENSINDRDSLHFVNGPGYYGGFPNPTRANPEGIFGNESNSPVPFSMANPVECHYRVAGEPVDDGGDGGLATFPPSTNGLTEYRATNFGGAMTGDLLAVNINNGFTYRMKLNVAGDEIVDLDPGSNEPYQVLFSNFGAMPLDITAQGDDDIFPGTIWIANYLSKTITVFEPADAGSWSMVAGTPDPTPRHEHAYVALNDKFYLIGGRQVKPVEEFDPATDQWTQKGVTPLEINHFQAVAYNNLIYVIGAMTGNYPHEVPLPDVHVYNPVNDQWSVGAEIPAGRRRGSAGVVAYNDKIYVVGGIQDGHSSGTVAWFDEFDPATGQWTTLPDAPHVRDHFHAAVVNGKLYAAGGRNSSDHGAPGGFFGAVITAVDVYDFGSGTWSTLANDLPTGRAGTATAVLGNELLIIGGESNQPNAHNATEALNTVNGTWRTLAPLNQARHGTQAIVHNNKVYVASGSGAQGGAPELASQEMFCFAPCGDEPPPAPPGDDPIVEPFPLDEHNGLNTFMPIDYPMFNNNPGHGLFGLGFTGLMTNWETHYEDLYDIGNLHAGGASGKLTIINVPAGTAHWTHNNQAYAFQFGVNVDANSGPFVVQTRMNGPFFNGQTPANHQSQGMYIGTGDQDNYLKIVLAANNGAGGIEVVLEENSWATSAMFGPGVLNATQLDLYLRVDPAAGKIQPQYALNGGAIINLGAPITLDATSPVRQVIGGSPAMAVGIIATSFGSNTSFTATWDAIKVLPADAEPPPPPAPTPPPPDDNEQPYRVYLPLAFK
jgi:N-acetylneuraminic acid mutarotase